MASSETTTEDIARSKRVWYTGAVDSSERSKRVGSYTFDAALHYCSDYDRCRCGGGGGGSGLGR